MQDTPEFKELRRRIRNFAFPLTAAFFLWYMLYVLLSTFAVDFMAQRIGGSNITVGLVMGLLQFVTTFFITFLYVRHMNKRVDPIADKIRHEMEGDDAN
ncbi:DUF485 domain-containing protein [Micrococcales bacterium 31B]|nr:DUF485 domain-containing protein [Micrococcales bacterium 31B]